MSVSKTIKEYKKRYHLCKRANIARHIILLTDSKGAAIKEVLPEFARGRFTIVNRGGATADKRIVIRSQKSR